MLRCLVEDYARRTAGDALQALDDKWMFTRSFFEQAAKRGAWAECHVYATHDTEAPLSHETRVNLRLGMGLEPSALPPWAWERLSGHERVLSPAARREAMFEGAIVLRRSKVEHATPARAAWWLDPAAPGQGYFVERRDGAARVVCCVYDDEGRPVWHAGHAMAPGDAVVLSTHALALSDDASRDPHARELELVFAAAAEARLLWASDDRRITLQHAGSPGWAATPASALGGCWIEDAQTPAVAAVVEYLDQRLFVALLGSQEWCVTSATRRGPVHYAGEWLRYSGGQALDGPYRPPGAPQRLGDARLWWTRGGRLLIEAPDGHQRVLRRWTTRESASASGSRPNFV
jgi:hypothetical protein